jgi:hypothetical protein
MTLEAVKKLRAGGCDLYFDTNVIRGKKATHVARFIKLCETLKRLRTFIPSAPKAKIVAAVYFEMMHQLRRDIPAFNEAVIIEKLIDMDVEIVALDQRLASSCAKVLYGWHPDETSWQAAKLHAKGKSSLDWLIASHMATASDFLVSDDQGVEFEPLRKANQVLSLENLEQLLNDWLAECHLAEPK